MRAVQQRKKSQWGCQRYLGEQSKQEHDVEERSGKDPQRLS